MSTSGSDTVPKQKVLSGNTQSSTTLSEGSSFTGTWESCKDYASVTVLVGTSSTTGIGKLTVEFSNDGSTAMHTLPMPFFAGEHKNRLIGCAVKAVYVRVSFTAVDIYDTRTPTVDNSFAALTILTQVSQAFCVPDIVINEQTVQFCGVNTLASGTTRVLGAGITLDTVATYARPTTGCILRVVNTSGVNNDEGYGMTGEGARTFLVTGLDANLNEIYWAGGLVASDTDVWSNGDGVSKYSSAVFVAVNDVRLLTYGSNGKVDAGSTITVQMSFNGWAAVAQLSASNGYKCSTGVYTVPAGYAVSPTSVLIASTSPTNTTVALSVVPYGARQASNVMRFDTRGKRSRRLQTMGATESGLMLVLEGTSTSGSNTVSAVVTMQLQQAVVNTSAGAVTPTLTADNMYSTKTYTEDTPLTLSLFTPTTTGSTLTVTLTLSDTGVGSLNTGTSGAVTSTFSNGVWQASGAKANVVALLNALVFTPTLNYNSNFTISSVVTDGSMYMYGTHAVTGIAVNDAPTATNLSTAQTFTLNTPVALTAIVIDDVDNTSLTATLTLSNTSAGTINTGTSGAVTSTFGSGVWSASGLIANVNTLLAALTFTPTTNFASSFTIATSVSDGALSATGSKTMTYNAPPSATNLSAAQTYSSTTALTAIVITDDSASVTATLTLSTTAAGSLSTGTYSGTSSSFDSGTGVWSATGSVANVNYLLAHTNYVPAGGYTSAFAIATYVTDGSASVSGSKAMTAAGANQPPYSPYLNFTARNVNNDGTWPAAGTSITVWKDTMNGVVPTWTTGTATIAYGQQASYPVLSVSNFRNRVPIAVANQFVNSFTQFIRMGWTYADGVGSYGCLQQDNTSTWYMHYGAFSWYGSFYIDHGNALSDYASGGGRMMSNSVVPASGFHNVCFRYNSSTKKGDIFLDGTNVKSGTFTGSGSNVTPPTGYYAQFGDDANAYKCQLICYNTALSDGEVANVFSYLTSEWT